MILIIIVSLEEINLKLKVRELVMTVIYFLEKIKLIMIYKKKEFYKEYKNSVYFLKLAKNNL